MIKGELPSRACQWLDCLSDPAFLSVMSGVITGPYFRKYFHEPGPMEVGTMVAVLEVGAFSEWRDRGPVYTIRAEF